MTKTDPLTARQEDSKPLPVGGILKDCYHSKISTGPRQNPSTERAILINILSSDRQSETEPVT
jgi:hypothetical protein